MQEKNKKIELLANEKVSKALLALGIPTMIGMMVTALYNLVDAYFVGNLGNSQMGAISVSYPLGQIIVGLGLLFGNGAASYISRLLGKNDKEKANNVASTAIYSSLITGATLIILTILFLKPILGMFGATESIMPYALSYTSIYLIFSIFNVFNVTMNNIITSEGAAKTTMFALLSGAILNIILDPIFIYSLDLGIAGAAIATAISQIVSTLVYIIYILKKKSIFNFKIKCCAFTKEIMSEIFKIGIPTLIFQLLTSGSIVLTNIAAKPYGDAVIAGIGAVTRTVSLITLMVFGFIKGLQPIAGYNYGARNYTRLKEAIKTSIKWTTIFCILIGIVFIFTAETIISSFANENSKMIHVGKSSLIASGLSLMVFGFYTVYSSLFLALGKAKEGLFLGICRQGICFIPIIFILPKVFGLNGIIYAQPAADLLSTIITIFMAIKLSKELKRQETIKEISS